MKRTLSRMAALLLALLLLFSLAACGGKEEAEPEASSASEEVSSRPAGPVAGGDPNEPQVTESGKYSSISDFLRSAEMRGQIKSLQDDLGESGMGLDVLAEDNRMIFSFTYPKLDGADESVRELVTQALETALDGQAETFETMAASLSDDVEVEDPVVVVRYTTSDGAELYSRDFTAQKQKEVN